jgi:hypothetical protein
MDLGAVFIISLVCMYGAYFAWQFIIGYAKCIWPWYRAWLIVCAGAVIIGIILNLVYYGAKAIGITFQ